MLLSIRQYGDPVLRAKSAPLDPQTEDLKVLADNMIETMYAANGIGLAAPQVGLNVQMVVIDIPEDEEEGEQPDAEPLEPEKVLLNGQEVLQSSIMPLIFINPKLELLGSPCSAPEGCLSVREIQANVIRPSHVKAQLQMLDGSTIELVCGGLLARCLQHEVDHLEGMLFTDRVSSAGRVTLNKKLKRLTGGR